MTIRKSRRNSPVSIGSAAAPSATGAWRSALSFPLSAGTAKFGPTGKTNTAPHQSSRKCAEGTADARIGRLE